MDLHARLCEAPCCDRPTDTAASCAPCENVPRRCTSSWARCRASCGAPRSSSQPRPLRTDSPLGLRAARQSWRGGWGNQRGNCTCCEHRMPLWCVIPAECQPSMPGRGVYRRASMRSSLPNTQASCRAGSRPCRGGSDASVVPSPALVRRRRWPTPRRAASSCRGPWPCSSSRARARCCWRPSSRSCERGCSVPRARCGGAALWGDTRAPGWVRSGVGAGAVAGACSAGGERAHRGTGQRGERPAHALSPLRHTVVSSVGAAPG